METEIERMQERIQLLNKEKAELKKQVSELTRDRDLYYGLYTKLRDKWHPSSGRKPMYSDGEAAGIFLDHYYKGKAVREIMDSHNMANSTVQRLLKRQLLQTVDSLSSGRMKLSGDTDHRNAEIGMLKKVIKNKWYTSDYMRGNIIVLLDKVGYHDYD